MGGSGELNIYLQRRRYGLSPGTRKSPGATKRSVMKYYEYVDPDDPKNQPSPNESWDDYPTGYFEYDDEEEDI